MGDFMAQGSTVSSSSPSDHNDAVHSPIAETQRRTRQSLPAQVDVAIVGCGLGGLEAGALLARSGLKVACLDAHYVAGGCATMYERGRSDARYRFDVGLHYIGDCEADGAIPTLLRRAGVQPPVFNRMDPDGFDTLVFPDFRFRIPADRDRYRDRLVEFFPKEKSGIDRYVRFLAEVDGMGRRMDKRGGKLSLGAAFDVLLHGRMMARYQNATVNQLLDDCTKDQKLKAVLLGQSGDYGVPPSEASALLHAGLAGHYFRGGGYYPKGGGQVFADDLARAIESAGSSVHLRKPVAQILVQNGKATGIRTEDGEVVQARAVISNADIRRTVLELLDPADVPAEWRQKAEKWQMGGALALIGLGLSCDVRELGMQATNYWQFDHYDGDAFYKKSFDGQHMRPQGSYITSTTCKDPDTPGHAPAGHSAVEVMSLLPGDPKLWGVDEADIATGKYRKNPVYLQHKAEIEADMVQRFLTLFPGARGHVALVDTGTPITHTRYTRATAGTGYGLAATPGQFLGQRPGYRSPIGGLYLAGASTRTGHGIVGALTSGLRSAERLAADLGTPLQPGL
jgi:all-trans-retinol 13,14-reductase